MDTVKARAYKIIQFALGKKAMNPVLLDMSLISTFCDYFIICSGESPRQVEAIYNETIHCAKKEKIKVHHTERDIDSQWMLIDFGSIVVHIFLDELREFYDLEHLWKEAKKVRLPKKNLQTSLPEK